MYRRSRMMLAAVAICLVGLAVPLVAQAGDNGRDHKRLLYATDTRGNLVSFRAGSPQRLRSVQAITGLPAGVSLAGIDFRPATGDLYGVGSDSVVYRINPTTGIAIAEGPAFTPALSGQSFGLDFNPTVDRIRLTSDADQNLRLHPDDANVVGVDANLNPGDPSIVGSAYTASSFSATRPAATVLYAVDSVADALFVQTPPNAGTLTMAKPLGIDLSSPGRVRHRRTNDVAYLVSNDARRGATLYRVNLSTGSATRLGRVGDGSTVTGLAAWQDQTS